MFWQNRRTTQYTILLNESTDANVSTKQHCISQISKLSHTIHNQSCVPCGEDATMAKDSLHWGGGCWNAVHRAHKMT